MIKSHCQSHVVRGMACPLCICVCIDDCSTLDSPAQGPFLCYASTCTSTSTLIALMRAPMCTPCISHFRGCTLEVCEYTMPWKRFLPEITALQINHSEMFHSPRCPHRSSHEGIRLGSPETLAFPKTSCEVT